VGESPYCGEVPAIVCQYFGSGEGFPGILVVVLVVGKHLDCSLVVDADINSSVSGSRRGWNEAEAFLCGM
jgi:hypothetical protein